MTPTPIELLQKELTSFQRALEKSIELVMMGVISEELHEIHKKNLTPKIKEYTNAINKLLE